ncbi:unannotated protein [freshwater metagenome]|uniref:Unannotated protein n=1 Tax=freshwater metagenome TaxID=449393 RepID=A0A6J6UVI6_9ZZZZ
MRAGSISARRPCSASACAYWPETNATSMPESPPLVILATTSSFVACFVTVTGAPVFSWNFAGRSSGM